MVPGMPHHTTPFRTHDGLRLHPHDWPLPRPRARLLLVHGLGEHGGRYARLAGELNAAGIAVRAYDQRGHGRSEGKAGTVGSTDDAPSRDVAAIFDRYAAEADDLPFLFGHSMGGRVVMHAVTVLGLAPRGVVASAPALASHANNAQRALARLLSTLWPSLTLRNGLPANRLSHAPQVEREYLDDPLNHERISARLAHFIFTGGPAVIEQAPRLSLPMLLQIAGDDHLVDPSGARRFAAAAPAEWLEAHDYAGLYHELYNEAEASRARVVGDLLHWLERQLA